MKYLFFLFLAFIGLHSLGAQNASYIKGDIIISISHHGSIEQFLRDANEARSNQFTLVEKLSKSEPIYLLRYDQSSISEHDAMSYCRSQRMVDYAQFNHIISERVVPDDPQLGQQWQWINDGSSNGKVDADVDAELAWDITTGGLTAAGDTIVVAVVDGGMSINHPDLAANMWTNAHEIPNNGIDDDNNGYVDDIHGWNVRLDNGTIGSNNHGTSVAGMIGAVGNNATGVTGINWNVKIMAVVYRSVAEADVIKAYDYILQVRKMYNETNGAKGAYVVASNSSWGLDNGRPADAPIWCNFYDLLGAQGVISVAATSNSNIDVDANGDLPTACPSEYLISVSNSNRRDQTVGAGYGPINIDLTAPGTNIYTLNGSTGYTSTTGTSFSSPLVAGIVGLAYSYPCSQLGVLMHQDAAAFALLVKDAILNGVDRIEGFDELFKSGGRANAFNTLNELSVFCSSCLPPVISVIDTTDHNPVLQLSNQAENFKLRYKNEASADWIELDNPSLPFTAEIGLDTCATYLFQAQNVCDTSSSDWSTTFTYMTGNCCRNVEITPVFDQGPNGLTISFEHTGDDIDYIIYYKQHEFSNFESIVSNSNNTVIDGLESCTLYDFYVTTMCPDGNIFYTDIITLITICNDQCGPFACIPVIDSFKNHIDQITINTRQANTGNNKGYIDTKKLFNLQLFTDRNNQLEIISAPGFKKDYELNIYIDRNNDGTFLLSERVRQIRADSGIDTITLVISNLTNWTDGEYKLRILTTEVGQPISSGCNSYGGEVEDYCVDIITVDQCNPVTDLLSQNISFNTASFEWSKPDNSAISYIIGYKKLTDQQYTFIADTATHYDLFNLEECKDYEFILSTLCDVDSSAFVRDTFKTKCTVSTWSIDNELDWKIFPNPFRENLTVLLTSYRQTEATLKVSDAAGRIVRSEPLNLKVGDYVIPIEMNQDLKPGVYYLSLVSKYGIKTSKVIKLQ